MAKAQAASASRARIRRLLETAVLRTVFAETGLWDSELGIAEARLRALSGLGDHAPMEGSGFAGMVVDDAAAMRTVRCCNSGT